MSEELKERKDMDPAYTWDLSSLYASDADWEKALPSLDTYVQKAAAFQGKLNTAANIRDFFAAETELSRCLDNLFCYASLRRSEDTRAGDAQAMYARIYGKYVEALSQLAFAQPEILSLPEEKIKAFADAPELADYKVNMIRLLREKPHTLSAAEEQLLASFGEVFGAPQQIADNLQDADLTFDSVKDKNGKTHELSGSNYIPLEMSGDRTLRENAFRSYYKSYKGHINTFAATYSAAVKAAATEARVRHYPSSLAMSLAGEHIPETVYRNLIDAVRDHMPDMYRYERLRKKILGIDELHYYDLYAPLAVKNEKHYTYAEAQQMVLDAVAPLGEDYVNTVRGAFRDRWIDVYPNAGKSGGAYSSGTYDSQPYILTNFSGSLDSVSTIAHEMGHSMHTHLSNTHQPPQYASYTLFAAEVASTVNENLLVENLLAKTEDPSERLALLNQYLEAFKGTVYRQTMFAEFEMQAHHKAETGEALTPDALNAIYAGLIRDYFGDELVWDDEVQYEWARIPHFYRPFYVYKYAVDYSAAVTLSEKIRAEGKPAVDRYLGFLSMGGSKDPLDALRFAGVDLESREPIDRALEKFGRVLDEAEKIAEA